MDFDKLNRETHDWNNGITRNISATDNVGRGMRASDLLANFNNYTYKANNGVYADRLYK